MKPWAVDVNEQLEPTPGNALEWQETSNRSRLKVFYRPEQSVRDNDSFSPSGGKPSLVVSRWRQLGLPIDECPFEPATRDDLALAHDRQYVDAVLDLKRPNGFGNTLPSVAASLQYTVGSMIAAARHAVTTHEGAVSPTSGFHHAGYANGGGFCTFNGLVIAALRLKAEGLARRIGIVDCDVHYGNGTDEIIGRLGLNWLVHYSYGGDPKGTRDPEQWLALLPRLLERFRDCDVVLYQAGADPHVDDPLGGDLTTGQLRDRDRLVFTSLRALGIPVAWNLAGGYQEPIEKVLALHDNTAREHLAALASFPGNAQGASTTVDRGRLR